MAAPTKDEWVQLFTNNIVKLAYEDREGTKSDRRVTLHPPLITYKSEAKPNRKVPANDQSVVVWDLDKKMWRRLKLENIMFVRGIESVQPNEETVE